jgi:hypothetical protein
MWTDRQTDIMTLTVAFRNFANTPKYSTMIIIFLLQTTGRYSFYTKFFRLLGYYMAWGGVKPTSVLTVEDGADIYSRNVGFGHLTPRNNPEDKIMQPNRVRSQRSGLYATLLMLFTIKEIFYHVLSVNDGRGHIRCPTISDLSSFGISIQFQLHLTHCWSKFLFIYLVSICSCWWRFASSVRWDLIGQAVLLSPKDGDRNQPAKCHVSKCILTGQRADLSWCAIS